MQELYLPKQEKFLHFVLTISIKIIILYLWLKPLIYERREMNATKEQWHYSGDERVWVGKYKNSQNTPHWHSDCELIYAECGELDVICDGDTYKLHKGDAMFIAGESLHCLHATDPETLLDTIVFDGNIIDGYAGTLALENPVLSRDFDIAELYETLLAELTEKPMLYTFSTAAYVNRKMLEIFRNEPTAPKKTGGRTDIKLKALFSEIRSRYDTYTLDDGARFMGMNASYLSRFFTARTGMHFMRYVNCVRVEKAVEMLRADELNVTEIADKCGFGTIRNFNRIFKLLTGYAPSALPENYLFSVAPYDNDSPSANPTLFGCELVECSSRPE